MADNKISIVNNKIEKIIELTQEIFDINENLKVLREILDQQEQEFLNTKKLIQTREDELLVAVRKRDDLEDTKAVTTQTQYPFVYVPTEERNPYGPFPFSPYVGPANNCSVCGIDLTQAMGYCCNNAKCPFPRVTCSTYSMDTK